MELSIVIPLFDEEGVIPELHNRLIGVTKTLTERYGLLEESIEIILVNDGSTDKSLAMLIALTKANKLFKVINLSRNFGHQIAATAGLEHATGNAVVPM